MEIIKDKKPISIQDALSEVFNDYKNVEERIAEQKGMVTGLSTGFYNLDYKTKGLQKGDLILLAGRKWMGKTGLALSIAHHIVMKEKVTTAIFNPSLSANQIAKHLLAIEMGDDVTTVLQGPRDDEDWIKIQNGMKQLGAAPLYIDDSLCSTVENIRKKCLNLKKEDNLGFVVIDYLQLLTCLPGVIEENIAKRVVLELKSLAREIKCPILVVSQLSSYGEKLWNLRPELVDLDESDYTRQYSDVIMMLYVSKLVKPDERENTNAELIVVKNRNGSVGKIKLKAELGGMRFKNLSM